MDLFSRRRARCLLSLVVVVAALSGLGQAQAHGSPAAGSAHMPELLDRARAAYANGDSRTAEPLFLEVLRQSPHSYEANESLGLIYAEAGAFARALPYLQAAAKERPGEAAAQANLGAALLQLGRDREAVDALTAAQRLTPRDPTASANLARALMKTGASAQAAEQFARAASLAQPDADLLYDWALALYPAAPAQATEVLARIPAGELGDQAESLWGDAEEKQGHATEAIKHLRRAAELAPAEPNLYALAVELLRHWSWPEAIEVLTFGRTRYPASDRLLMALGVAQFGNANYPEAAATFSSLLARTPDSALYGDMLGRTCDAMVETAGDSCAALQGFADQHPGNAQIDTYAAASILHSPAEKQDLPRAARLLEEATSADPRASEAWYQLGVLEQQQLKWDESVQHLEQAVTLRPTFAEAHYRLARAYFHRGQKDKGNAEIALQRQYQAEEKEALDRKLKDVTRFVFSQP